jgi:hypothetical protein
MPNPEAQISIRDLLFGDMPLDTIASFAAGTDTDSPWSHFAIAHHRQQQGDTFGAIVELEKVLDMERLESRITLQAWYCLRQLGSFPPADVASEIKGVVVEAALVEGLDLVAAYADHSARYFNYSGAAVIWDIPDPEMDKLIDRLLSLGQEIISHVDLWEESRPPAPPAGSVRINLLTYGGLYFGEAAFETMGQDPLGGQALKVAIALMKALIARQTGQTS